MRLILVRHGVTSWNERNRFQGWSDVPLSAQGRRQAIRLKRALNGEAVAAVYSSDLSRAFETACAVAEPHKIKVQIRPELRELDFGKWEGLTCEAAHHSYPAQARAWLTRHGSFRPPEGETLATLSRRVCRCLRTLWTEHDNAAVVVTHGGPIRAILSRVLGLSVARFWQIKVDPGSFSILEGSWPRPCIIQFNSVFQPQRSIWPKR